MRVSPIALPISLCIGVALCMGSAGCEDGRARGSVQLHLGPSPVGDYRELRLELQRIDGYAERANGERGWVILATPNQTLSLSHAAPDTRQRLPMQSAVPVGRYEALRLALGPLSQLRARDGSLHALVVPPSDSPGIPLGTDFEVQRDTISDGTLSFDSLEATSSGSGNEQSYALQQMGQGAPASPSGTIFGKLIDKANGQGISGVALFGETIDSDGRPRVARTAVTSDTGDYTLNMLPLDETYYVVSRPYVNGSIYDAQASGALTLTSGFPTACWGTELSLSSGVGGVAGEITPTAASDQSDQLSLVKQFTRKGGTSPWLIIDTTIAQVGATETYSFTRVPADKYSIFATRLIVHPDGTISTGALGASAPFAVVANQVARADVTYP